MTTWLLQCYKRDINKHNLNQSRTPGHPYRILIGGSGSEKKTNALLNLIKQLDNGDYSTVDKIHSYVKDPYEVKYQYLIKKCEDNGIKI